MKKILFVLVLTVSLYSSGQEIGVRFGEVSGNNVAVDGMFDTGNSRIHANVSFGDGVGMDALWHLLYKPIGGAEGFSWYAGPGASAYIGDNIFLLGISGEIGIEYAFEGVPISIGLDYRPTLWVVEETDFEAGGFGLNVRWRFN
jgi:hypothetical protein